MSIRSTAAGAVLVAAIAVGGASLVGQGPPADADVFGGLRWRDLGPARGGRTTALAGAAADPRLLYLGTAGGGVWKSADYGQTWRPIFDRQSTGVIGAIAVALSDPRVVYAGTGAVLPESDLPSGDGLYKSSDAGETWSRIGLPASARIARIAVHPTDANQILIAAMGDDTRPGGDRGVFRSTDGGRTIDRVLAGGGMTGAIDVRFDSHRPAVAYASLWQPRPSRDAGADRTSGVFKSTDGGATWLPVANGLPTVVADGLGRTSLAVSAARPGRVYVNVSARSRAGLYRSDDDGASWTFVGAEPSLAGAAIEADPLNPDVVYAASATGQRSQDGGRTWARWQSEAGGPYHQLWIHPTQPAVAALAGNDGAAVTVNGGATWTAGLGQPTTVFTQVVVDTAFPYRVCAAGPPGVFCTPSRGPGWFGEWPASGDRRSSYVAVDPSDPEQLYGAEVRRYDRRTGQVQDVSPPGQPASSLIAAAPLVFSPTNARTLYYASDVLWTSTTGGQTWAAASPDFAAASGTTGEGARGAISAVSVSSIDGRAIWIGTAGGRIHLTRDQGATWREVTPADLAPSSAVIRLEASHYDTNTAYAVLVSDGGSSRTRVLRTRDAGGSWADISRGLGPGLVYAVREDSARRGLLFAGGDGSVSLSFDDGDSWRSLRLNLPPAPVRDLLVKDADLVVATAGRGLWVLDDMSPLRQITADVLKAPAFLFRPATAWRTRTSPVRPTPADTEMAPDGVALTYALGAAVEGTLTLEITEGPASDVVRRYSSEDAGTPLRKTPGIHRVRWDVRHTAPAVDWLADDGGAVTPLEGRWVLPGTFQVRLGTGRGLLRQAVLVRLDPRIRTSAADLAIQTSLTRTIEDSLASLESSYRSVRGRPSVLPGTPMSTASSDILARLRAAGRDLARMFAIVQQADARPTAATEAAVADALARAKSAAAEAQ